MLSNFEKDQDYQRQMTFMSEQLVNQDSEIKHLICVRDALNQQVDDVKAMQSRLQNRIALITSENLVLANESQVLKSTCQRL